MKGKTLLVLGAVGLGAIALYLYLRHSRPTTANPTISGLGGTHWLAKDPQDAQDPGAAQILASFRGIAGDDPSTIKGDVSSGKFYASSTENRTAMELFIGTQVAGARGAIAINRPTIL